MNAIISGCDRGSVDSVHAAGVYYSPQGSCIRVFHRLSALKNHWKNALSRRRKKYQFV